MLLVPATPRRRGFCCASRVPQRARLPSSLCVCTRAMDTLGPKRKASAAAAAKPAAKPRTRGEVHEAPTQAIARANEARDVKDDDDEDNAASAHLDFFVTDVEHAKGDGSAGGAFLVWGVTHDAARTLCVRVADFAHGFFARAPTVTQNGGALTTVHLDAIHAALATRCGVDATAVSVELCQKTPIMYYRPASSGPTPFLRLGLVDGARPGRLSAAASRVAADEDGALAAHGLSWRQYEAFEEDVKPLVRFLADSELCGGGWARLRLRRSSGDDDASPCAVEVHQRLSRCAREFACPWRALTSLTPDATQLADATHAATLTQLLSCGGPAADAAAAGKLPPLSCCFLNVQLACVTANGNGGGNGGGASSCASKAATSAAAAAAASPPPFPTRTPNASTDPIIAISAVLAPLPHGGAALRPTAQLHFTWCSSSDGDGDGAGGAPPGVTLRAFATERAMLSAFCAWLVEEADPDIVAVFEVYDSIAALLTRADKLRMPPLRLGRHATQHASIKSMIQYSPAWVKAQQR